MHAWDHLKEVTLSSLPPWQFGLRWSNREETQPHPSTENWIKDWLSMAPSIRIWIPPQSLIRKLPLASYCSPSNRLKTTIKKLTNLITWTTALSNSVKLWATPCMATRDRWVMVESSDKTWSTGEGNGKPLQHSSLENPMNSMKRQKGRTLKDELPSSSLEMKDERWKIPSSLLEISGEITPERIRDGAKAKTTPSCGYNWWWK